MRYPVKLIGDSTLVKSLLISAGPCKLTAIIGYNNGGAAFLNVFEAAAVPANGTKSRITFAIAAASAFALALPNPLDLDACCCAVSSTVDTYTDAGGTPATIQALLAS